jgi:outer membrane protein, heavy metal efflux system
MRIGKTARMSLLAALVLVENPPGAPAEAVAAQPPDRSEEAFRMLDDLVREALRSNPSIRAARSRWTASTKRPSQVSTLPNPEFRISSMTGNPLPYSTIGSGPLDWASFMFMQKIPWPGKLSLEGEVAEADAAVRARNYEAVTLEVVREVKEAFFRLHYIHQTQEILRRYRDLLERFARIAEARYGVGEGLMQDVLRAQVEVSLIEERLEVLAGRREGVRARINSLLNRPPEASLPDVPTFTDVSIEVPFSLESLYLMARERNPEIDADRLEIRRASLERERARKDFLPDFTVSAGYFQRGGGFGNMYEYTVGIEIPLYWRRKESRAVEESVEALEGTRHEYQRKLQEVTYRIKDAYIGARTSRRLLDLYRTGIIPQATAALDSSLSSYQVGTVDFLTLTTNALTILTYELQYAAELRDYHENLVNLERQLGVNLVGEAGATAGPRP